MRVHDNVIPTVKRIYDDPLNDWELVIGYEAWQNFFKSDAGVYYFLLLDRKGAPVFLNCFLERLRIIVIARSKSLVPLSRQRLKHYRVMK